MDEFQKEIEFIVNFLNDHIVSIMHTKYFICGFKKYEIISQNKNGKISHHHLKSLNVRCIDTFP